MITAHSSMDIRYNFREVREIMNISMEWLKKILSGGQIVVKFNLILERETHFLTKNFINKY